MVARTAGGCSVLDRPWTLEDVISIPSDSESDRDDDDLEEYDFTHMRLVQDQNVDDSRPSISAIVATMVSTQQVPTKDIEVPTQELCVAEGLEDSDPSASKWPTEAFFASSVPECPRITAESELLVSPAIQQHYIVVSPVLPTPTQVLCLVSAASQSASAPPAPILPLVETVLHWHRADSSCQARLSAATNLIQPFQQRNRSTVSSNRCSQIHNDHGHMDGAVPQNDDELHGAGQPALTKTPPLGCSPVSAKRSSTEVDQQHRATDDILPLITCLSPPSANCRPGNEPQTSTNAHHNVSVFDESCEEIAKRSSCRHGYRKVYNLRPFPVKRQLYREQKRDEEGELCVLFPPSKERGSQQAESELSRNRKPRLLGTKSIDKASVANTKRPAPSGVGSSEERSLAHTVSRFITENETALFQGKTVAAQNNPVPEAHQLPNEGERLRPTKDQFTRRTENIAQPSIQATYPNVYPDIYRVDCLLARWRQHTFLVKWSDAPGTTTTTWESRKRIIDKVMLSEFEASWQGFDAGVDVLGVRLRAGKRQYLLHWHGRPSKEDAWVYSDRLSPQLIGRVHDNRVRGAQKT